MTDQNEITPPNPGEQDALDHTPATAAPHRVELDPPTGAEEPDDDERGAPPEQRAARRAMGPDIQGRIDELIAEVAGGPVDAREGAFVRDLVTASLKLIPDGRHMGELKLMALALKELRYAFRVFGMYPDEHKVTIFGSARTAEDHPDYLAAVEFSRIMAQRHWMVITGAGDGIMKAGHVGPGRDASFGVAIRLPFEQKTNDVIAGDAKLINFRYFFTRKLMFLSQAEAVVCFPGGFGTLDEAFETLTLIQTGKASMIPIVLVDGKDENGNTYWDGFDRFVREQLLTRGWISPEDPSLYYHAKDAVDAADHVTRFYRNYHSSRYVGDQLVIRVKNRLRDEDIATLNEEFKVLVASGKIHQRGPFSVEDDHLELPRIVFTHTRHKYAIVRKLIDRINSFDMVSA